MVEVDHDIGSFLLGIGELEYPGVHGSRHLGRHTAVKSNPVISWVGAFLAVIQFGRFDPVAHAGEEEEVSKVGDSGAAQVRQAEALDIGL